MAEDFELDTRQLGALPIITAFADRLGMDALLETFLPPDDARLKPEFDGLRRFWVGGEAVTCGLFP